MHAVVEPGGTVLMMEAGQPRQDGGEDVDEALVLVGYAATMEAVQQFEFALKELAVQRDELPESIDADTAWKRVERILFRPMGRLQYVFPNGLRERYRDLKRIRNHLAHDVLVRWRLERDLGLCTDQEVVDALIEVEDEFRMLEEHLSVLAKRHLHNIGIDPKELHVDRKEMRSMLLGDTEDADQV